MRRGFDSRLLRQPEAIEVTDLKYVKVQKSSQRRPGVSIAIVLLVLSLSLSVFPARATDRDNQAIRIYEAFTAIDVANTEYVIMSGIGESMSPTIRDGDTVKVQLYTGEDSIDVGDIIVYHAWMVGVYRAMWIGHRVTEKIREGDTWTFKTKGDNCIELDIWKVPEDAILGEIVSVDHIERSIVPSKKTSETDMHTRTRPPMSGTFLLIGGSFCLGAILTLINSLKRRKQKKAIANLSSCYNCGHLRIPTEHNLAMINGRLRIQKTLMISRSFCRQLNPKTKTILVCEHYEPKILSKSQWPNGKYGWT